MSNKRFLVLTLVAITLALMTVACGNNPQQTNPETENVAEPANEETTTQVEAEEATVEEATSEETTTEETEVVEEPASTNEEEPVVEEVAETDSAAEAVSQEADGAVEVAEEPTATDEWQEFTSEAGNFTILFPQEPVENTQEAAGTEINSFIVDEGSSAYMVMYTEFPAELVNNDLLSGMLDQFFSDARDGMLASIDGTLTTEDDFTFEGYPGRHIEFDVADGRLPNGGTGVIDFYFIGNRLYQVGTLTNEEDAAENVETFLTSFNLLDTAAVGQMDSTQTAGAEPVTAPSYDTVFPLPENVQNFTSQNDASQGINFQTDLTMEEAMSFYRQQFTQQGLTERELLTVTSDTTFSMVFDGAENGKALAVQGVILGETINLNLRFEDI